MVVEIDTDEELDIGVTDRLRRCQSTMRSGIFPCAGTRRLTSGFQENPETLEKCWKSTPHENGRMKHHFLVGSPADLHECGGASPQETSGPERVPFVPGTGPPSAVGRRRRAGAADGCRRPLDQTVRHGRHGETPGRRRHRGHLHGTHRWPRSFLGVLRPAVAPLTAGPGLHAGTWACFQLGESQPHEPDVSRPFPVRLPGPCSFRLSGTRGPPTPQGVAAVTGTKRGAGASRLLSMSAGDDALAQLQAGASEAAPHPPVVGDQHDGALIAGQGILQLLHQRG